MPLELVNVGFGNTVAVQRVIAVIKAGSSPMKRLVDSAERQNRLVDATNGRRTRSIVVTDSNHVVLSHLQPETLSQKLAGSAIEDEQPAEATD
ncbi:MAG: DUF370 domain-containing protein [Planctomycetes bacterium]|nr:DUF370 domain-containing protein [Planctomycetota bacterium]MBM4080426.1 DUF370 domain-containing protein [Planctomycetota bacterium]MBM4083625.1 DUF370 domain-containing protein [Planctomycetota bacterium]